MCGRHQTPPTQQGQRSKQADFKLSIWIGDGSHKRTQNNTHTRASVQIQVRQTRKPHWVRTQIHELEPPWSYDVQNSTQASPPVEAKIVATCTNILCLDQPQRHSRCNCCRLPRSTAVMPSACTNSMPTRNWRCRAERHGLVLRQPDFYFVP